MTLDLSEKLDFNNVLIKPKRSTLESRSQVDLVKEFKPKYGTPFKGIGIVSANMASGTFNMLDALSKHQCFIAIAKHNNDQWIPLEKALNIEEVIKRITWGFYTIGMNKSELQKLITFHNICKVRIGNNIANQIKICVDIANGYTQKFASFISLVRETFPSNIIVAGNVATPEMVQELIINGADYVKIGVGPGCFIAESLIKTNTGLQKIKDIKVGDFVFTHTGKLRKVLGTINYYNDEELISINGITSTKHHEYYVVERKYVSIVNDENIHDYAKWVKAEELDKEKHLLIQIH